MSTVLWPNLLADGRVTCAEVDLYALYKYSNKLDRISRKLGVTPFLDLQDTTDLEFNHRDQGLPDGLESTEQVMALEGTWVDAKLADATLSALLDEVQAKQVRFGTLTNHTPQVASELNESLEFARRAAAKSAQFNFVVVT